MCKFEVKIVANCLMFKLKKAVKTGRKTSKLKEEMTEEKLKIKLLCFEKSVAFEQVIPMSISGTKSNKTNCSQT